MISCNAGLALLPRRAASVIQSPDIVFVPIEGFTLVRSLHLLTPKRATLSKAAGRFIRYLTH
jgi:DNA-binding transcriptional LysR family regulator